MGVDIQGECPGHQGNPCRGDVSGVLKEFGVEVFGYDPFVDKRGCCRGFGVEAVDWIEGGGDGCGGDHGGAPGVWGDFNWRRLPGR